MAEAVTAQLSYLELHTRAAAIAAILQSRVPRGERVVLLYPNDHQYVAAFFGCLYAGVIAVPAYPPESARQQHLQRLFGILRDAAPRLILTSAQLAPLVTAGLRELPAAARIEVLATDTIDLGARDHWEPLVQTPDDIAFLQYTSGSTSTPKGVIVSHGNLVANSQAAGEAFGFHGDDVMVSWLPLFHDMGLIGGLLQ